MSAHLQIGEVAARTGLSLRTIRYYGEIGLVEPTARSEGGFRLYTEGDIARLRYVSRMKPLEFTLEEMRDLLAVLDDLARGDDLAGAADALAGAANDLAGAANDLAGAAGEHSRRQQLVERLAMYHEVVHQRRERLAEQLHDADRFIDDLRGELDRFTSTASAQ